MIQASASSLPSSVTITGTLQRALGCRYDWRPECPNTRLSYDPADDVWQGTFHLRAGDYEYKVALNDSWEENYGLHATPHGPNIPLSLAADTAVTFYYDHKTHWVTDNQRAAIATVVGNFQHAIGCPRDWQPDCLRTWLQDPTGSGIYSCIVSEMPAGTYEAKVALGESWTENYGANGTRNGPHIAFTVPSDETDVYFGYNPATHVLTISVGGPPRGDLRLAQAHWVARDTIAWHMAGGADAYYLHYDPAAGMHLEPGGVVGGLAIPLSYDPVGLSPALRAKFPHLAGLPVLRIDPADLAHVPEILKGQIAVSARNELGWLADATALQVPGVLDDLYTYFGPLGVIYDGDTPTLKVWAPTAGSVTLRLFDTSTTPISAIIPTHWDPATGVWSAHGRPDWTGKYYLYEVEVYVRSTGRVEHNLVTDPYSISLAMNSTRSQIVNLDDPGLKPPGWDSLAKPPLDGPHDIVIYELHVRDFSANDPSVPAALKGTFEAFTLADSFGMKHLKALAEAGLTHIHLLPVFDFATVNENKARWQEPDWDTLSRFPSDSDRQQALVGLTRDRDGYNWGYDPFHYTAPEGSYATNPDGPQRILEFRAMVKALSETGLRVAMDVVYNHTHASGQGPLSVLDKVVPGYYYRLTPDGHVYTSTCCPDTATEHAMMEKLMVDSLVSWTTTYKVDAFRFDLMGFHMLSNMLKVRDTLRSLTLEQDGVDGSKIYLYGEGWDFGEVAGNARGVNATQWNTAGTGIGTFNDRLRDAARGGGAFTSKQEQGFIDGLYYDPNGTSPTSPRVQKTQLLKYADWVRLGLIGNLRNYVLLDYRGAVVAGSEMSYNGSAVGYALNPQETVNYVSAHDNETLFDAIQYKAPISARMDARVRMHNLGISLVMLGQGVPFFDAGADLLRSKSLDRDSFNSGDWFNKLDFTYAANNWGVGLPPAWSNEANWPLMRTLLANPTLKPGRTDIARAAAHFQEMLGIRKSSRLFRLGDADQVQACIDFFNTGPGQIPGLIIMCMSSPEGADGDSRYQRIVVVFNATRDLQRFAEPTLVGYPLALHPIQAVSGDQVVRTAIFERSTGLFAVPGRTTAVFVAPW